VIYVGFMGGGGQLAGPRVFSSGCQLVPPSHLREHGNTQLLMLDNASRRIQGSQFSGSFSRDVSLSSFILFLCVEAIT
jgi:hypothetical protein